MQEMAEMRIDTRSCHARMQETAVVVELALSAGSRRWMPGEV